MGERGRERWGGGRGGGRVGVPRGCVFFRLSDLGVSRAASSKGRPTHRDRC